MAYNKILQYITSTSSKLLKTNCRSKLSCSIYTSSLLEGWFSKKKEIPTGPTIIRPNTRVERNVPLLETACRAAVVIGGSGCGFAAADHLLCKGALGVVILDDDTTAGEYAAKKLCDDHGLGRAHYVNCDVRDSSRFEAGLCSAVCIYKKIHVIFNDLDKKRYPKNLSRCHPNENVNDVASKVINVGVRLMSKENDGPGGIIINCASLLGFTNFPEDPTPIYCMKEKVIETTMHYAQEYNFEKTGVRLITLCPVNKPFSKIALPDLSKLISKYRRNERPCVPSLNEKIGPALDHVIAQAQNGSTWVVEPMTCSTENPHQIFFPSERSEKLDPKVHNIKEDHHSRSETLVRCSCKGTAPKKK